ncbi:MAG: hypothetical protein SPG86_05735, partial [Gemmiger sp.]
RLLQQPQDQGKAKGLAACNSQTASPFGCLNNFYFTILSNFLGALQFCGHPGLFIFFAKPQFPRNLPLTNRLQNGILVTGAKCHTSPKIQT